MGTWLGWRWWWQKCCWRSSTNSRVKNRQNSREHPKNKSTCGNRFGFVMQTIACIVTRFTRKTGVAHISTIKRYHRSRQEASIHLIVPVRIIIQVERYHFFIFNAEQKVHIPLICIWQVYWSRLCAFDTFTAEIFQVLDFNIFFFFLGGTGCQSDIPKIKYVASSEFKPTILGSP